MIVIYHNPRCSTSRGALQAIRESGVEPCVIPYLETGWTRGQLLGLFAAAGLTPGEALRTKQPEAAGIDRSDAEAVLAAMVESPILVERPFVCAPKGVRLCRPLERIEEIL